MAPTSTSLGADHRLRMIGPWVRRSLHDLKPHGIFEVSVFVVSVIFGSLLMVMVALEGSFLKGAAVVAMLSPVVWVQSPRRRGNGIIDRAGYMSSAIILALMAFGLLVGRAVVWIAGA